MNCEICKKPSGFYPICKDCNKLKEKGLVEKCKNCKNISGQATFVSFNMELKEQLL